MLCWFLCVVPFPRLSFSDDSSIPPCPSAVIPVISLTFWSFAPEESPLEEALFLVGAIVFTVGVAVVVMWITRSAIKQAIADQKREEEEVRMFLGST